MLYCQHGTKFQWPPRADAQPSYPVAGRHGGKIVIPHHGMNKPSAQSMVQSGQTDKLRAEIDAIKQAYGPADGKK